MQSSGCVPKQLLQALMSYPNVSFLQFGFRQPLAGNVGFSYSVIRLHSLPCLTVCIASENSCTQL